MNSEGIFCTGMAWVKDTCFLTLSEFETAYDTIFAVLSTHKHQIGL